MSDALDPVESLPLDGKGLQWQSTASFFADQDFGFLSHRSGKSGYRLSNQMFQLARQSGVSKAVRLPEDFESCRLPTALARVTRALSILADAIL